MGWKLFFEKRSLFMANMEQSRADGKDLGRKMVDNQRQYDYGKLSKNNLSHNRAPPLKGALTPACVY